MMLKEILTRCGYRCDLCLAYKDNIENDDQRDILSDTWHKIYGFKIPAEKILCEGCISCDTPKLIDSNCPVRPCVIENGLENCSQCKKFPCDLFNQRKVVYQDFTKNKNISRKEYSRCIKPYENNERLNEIRKNNFPFSRLFNSEIIPNYDSILKFISNRQTVNYWLDLMSFIDNTYYELDKKILFGGRNKLV